MAHIVVFFLCPLRDIIQLLFPNISKNPARSSKKTHIAVPGPSLPCKLDARIRRYGAVSRAEVDGVPGIVYGFGEGECLFQRCGEGEGVEEHEQGHDDGQQTSEHREWLDREWS